MGETIKFVLKRIFYFFFDNPVIVAVIIGVIALLLIFGAVSQSCDRKAKQKDEQNKEEILKDKGKIEILEKQEKEIIEKEKQVNENSKRSEANFNSIIRRDSSDFNSNFNSAKRKFCEQPEFFNDSRCRQN